MFLCIFLILSCASLFMLPTKLQLKGGPLLIIVFTSSSSNRIFECRWYLICILSAIVTIMLCCLLPNSVACNAQDLCSQVWVSHRTGVPCATSWGPPGEAVIISNMFSYHVRDTPLPGAVETCVLLKVYTQSWYNLIVFFLKISNWKIIALQYCVDFCHT